ncbi:MAG: hypothetical protein Q8R50_14405 [Sediminibacterium sp.]|nr:hypothetical protein [Sediminibacterium sp.]
MDKKTLQTSILEKLIKDFFKTYKEFYERFWQYLNNQPGYREILIDKKEITTEKQEKPIHDFAGGYGFGIRSTLLGYFMKLDAGRPMKGVFVGKPIWYFALGFDF